MLQALPPAPAARLASLLLLGLQTLHPLSAFIFTCILPAQVQRSPFHTVTVGSRAPPSDYILARSSAKTPSSNKVTFLGAGART